MTPGGGLLLSAASLIPRAMPIVDSPTLQQKLPAIVTKNVGAGLAENKTGFDVLILDATTGATVSEASYHADRFIYPASTIKILVAASIYRRIDEGRTRLTNKVKITQPNAADECRVEGTCSRLGPGKTPTVAQLLEDMLTISSNIATNQLIDLFGKEQINDDSRDWNLPTLKVYRKLYAVKPAEDPLPEQRNTATAGDFASLWAAIAWAPSGILSTNSRNDLLARLRRQRDNDRLNRYFPADVFFFHKPGNTSEVTGDAGFFLHKAADGKEYIVVIAGLLDFARYSKNSQSTSAYQALADIGRDVLTVVRGARKQVRAPE